MYLNERLYLSAVSQMRDVIVYSRIVTSNKKIKVLFLSEECDTFVTFI